MEIALKRIQQCIQDNNTSLDLSGLKLVKLPDNLPASLQKLSCSNNQLTSLPDNLPASLRHLHCSSNQLTSLPNNLPASLQTLFCNNNQLTSFPDNLPASLQILYYYNNPYLHITKVHALRFDLKETPNYVKYVNIIKNKRKAMKRYNRLKFCNNLEEHATEFLLRPGNYYYTMLEQNNSHLFMNH